MSYENQLNVEINKELDRLAEEKLPWRASFIAHAVCAPHVEGLPKSDDREFWLHCTYEKVRISVTKCINRRAGDAKEEEERRQYTLDGYDHVHLYYVIRREGEDIGVPVEEMSDNEIDLKTERFREMGRNCLSHADELQRFKRERRAAA